MKRMMAGLLLPVLLLTACTREQPTATRPTTEPTEPAGLRCYDSTVEAETGGGVWEFPLPHSDYIGVYTMNDDVILVRETGEITALSGEQRYLSASVQIGSQAVMGNCFAVFDAGVSYYDAETNRVVLLNKQLRKRAEIRMPDAIVGQPIYSPESKEIFYLQGQELRALDTQTGISRLVLTRRYEASDLLGVFLGGNVLTVRAEDPDGVERNIYIRTQTGQILWETEQPHTLQSWGNRYMLYYTDALASNWIFGVEDAQPKQFHVPYRTVYPMLAMNGVVTCDTSSDQAVLAYYDLVRGRRVGQVTVSNMAEPVGIANDGTSVWILGRQGKTMTLYRWDVQSNPTGDETVYTGTLFTAENPDTEGIQTCRELAQQIGTQYGVELCLWDEADLTNAVYEPVAEYQVQTIRQMLEELEVTLSLFPDGFLKNTVRSGSIRICLVRSIRGGATCAQYYREGNAYILLTWGGSIQADFIRSLASVVDSHVLGNSRDYDTWGQLNPKGFVYLYEKPEQTPESLQKYLEGEKRAFIDTQAMEDPLADRCQIFLYATTPGNEEYFASHTMQKKLCRLCEGIREAYGLEKDPDHFLWEQYLKQEMSLKR